MKKVFFVSPDEKKFLSDAGDRLPLGILYVATSAQKAGYDVRVYDLNHSSRGKLVEDILLEGPNAVSYSVVSSPSFNYMNSLLRTIKINSPKTINIVGGYHAIARPQDFEYADYVVKGDGEQAILDILEGRKVYNDLQRVDVNDIPFPDRNLVNTDNYNMQQNGHRCATLISSRGCPFSCLEENQRIWFSRKPNNKIKTARIGDKVVSLNENFGELEESEIKNIRTQKKEIFEIELENGNKLKLTDDHRVYTKRGWIAVQNLKENDEILNFDFREKISFNKKILNPMKKKNIVRKMIDTTRKRGWYKIASKRMKQKQKDGVIEQHSEKQNIARRKSKNKGRKNGMWKEDRKDRNFGNLKKLVLKKKIKNCSICNSNKHLCVHHIDKNKNNDNLDNLLIVCKSCHSKIHKIVENFK